MKAELSIDSVPTPLTDKSYEQPRIAELGNVSGLTTYSVSVRAN